MAPRSGRAGNSARPRLHAGACAVSDPDTGSAGMMDAGTATPPAAAPAGASEQARSPAPRHAVLERLERLAYVELDQARPLAAAAVDEDATLAAYIGWDLDAPAS